MSEREGKRQRGTHKQNVFVSMCTLEKVRYVGMGAQESSGKDFAYISIHGHNEVLHMHNYIHGFAQINN